MSVTEEYIKRYIAATFSRSREDLRWRDVGKRIVLDDAENVANAAIDEAFDRIANNPTAAMLLAMLEKFFVSPAAPAMLTMIQGFFTPLLSSASPLPERDLANACKLCGAAFLCDNGKWSTTCFCARDKPHELQDAQIRWERTQTSSP